MADQDTNSGGEGISPAAPHLPAVRSVVLDDDALVRVEGTLDSSNANLRVARAVRDAVAAGATAVVVDLGEVEFAGVELAWLLGEIVDVERGIGVVLVSPPKTMLLAMDALRLRHLLVVRDEPIR